MTVTILIGDVRDRLLQLPDDHFDIVVTSPPYWGLRDYGVAGQLGLEPTLGEHLSAMVEVFREVLAHHYGANLPGEPPATNGVPNYGDMTKFREWPDADIDVLVGGTPCQAFSVAGLRKGLDDPRGNLTLVYLGLVERYRPEWVVWENVPGVLSSFTGPEPESDLDLGAGWEAEETSDFACFLGGLQELGYGFAYRVLDAQFIRVDGHPRAVPQRRERVFVVGHSSGDFRRAAAVLFEPESLRGDPAPSREAGQGVATDVAPGLVSSGRGVERIGETRGQDAVVAVQAFGGGNTSGPVEAAACLTAKGQRLTDEKPACAVETFIAAPVAASLTRGAESAGRGGYAGRRQEDDVNLVAHALRADGFDASEDGTGRGTPIVPIAFPERMSATQYGAMEGVCGALGALNPQAVVYSIQERAVSENPNAGPQGAGYQPDIAYTLEARHHVQAVATQWAVRRLTPTECERLQGFPEIQKSVTVIVCDDVNSDHAKSAKRHFLPKSRERSAPVLAHVLINLEQQVVEIHRAGRLFWSANTADHQSLCPLSMPLDDFVRLVAHMTAIAVPQTSLGKEASLASTNSFFPRLHGSKSVVVFGREIAAHASAASPSTTSAREHLKSTTLRLGPTGPISGWSLQTSCSYAVHAMSSCIPSEMMTAYSYAITFETVQGYTHIARRNGKPAADGPRYKALGNSMACNVMRWIGQRIQIAHEVLG